MANDYNIPESIAKDDMFVKLAKLAMCAFDADRDGSTKFRQKLASTDTSVQAQALNDAYVTGFFGAFDVDSFQNEKIAATQLGSHIGMSLLSSMVEEIHRG